MLQASSGGNVDDSKSHRSAESYRRFPDPVREDNFKDRFRKGSWNDEMVE